MQIKPLLGTIRAKFLLLPVVCVMLVIAPAIKEQLLIPYSLIGLILIAAILAHVAVNTLNEYLDFKSGLDLNTIKTPFSGGSGSIPNYPHIATKVLLISIISLLLLMFIGLYLSFYYTPELIIWGMAGCLLILTYTQWLNRHPLLCLFAPGLGFATIMMGASSILLRGKFPLDVFMLSMIPFFQINNLLLLNQYPDIKADTQAGRKTFPIVFGVNKSNLIYLTFALLSLFFIPLLVMLKSYPAAILWALIPAALSLYAFYGAKKLKENISTQEKYLAANVACSLLTPFVLSLAIIYG